MTKHVIERIVEYEEQPVCKTAAQMEDICCGETEELTCCEKANGTWSGKTAQELLEKYHPNLDSHGRDSKGNYVVVQLQSRKNPCGEKIIEYDVSGGNCCQDVSEIIIDEDATPDVIIHGHSIIIYFDGGRAPYTVRTTAANTYFANGEKEYTTNRNYVQLNSNGDFCGSTEFRVTDGCSNDTTILRSDVGQWVLVQSRCALSGVIPSQSGGNLEAISGKYKQLETVVKKQWQKKIVCADDLPFTPLGDCIYASDADDCLIKQLTEIEAIKPVGYEQNTCLDINMYTYVVPWINFPYNGTTATPGGYWMGGGGVTTVDCTNLDPWYYLHGGGIFQNGIAAQTSSLTLYEWRC